MNRIHALYSAKTFVFSAKTLVLMLPLAAVATGAMSGDARAQPAPPPPPGYVAPPPAPAQDAPPAPPDAYIATVQPEYYEGRPVYWYNGSWYYRGPGGAWGYYRTEPAFLRDRRGHWNEHARYHYHR